MRLRQKFLIPIVLSLIFQACIIKPAEKTLPNIVIILADDLGYGIETPSQLYNLATDPGEKVNLYANHPDIVEELTKELEKIKLENI